MTGLKRFEDIEDIQIRLATDDDVGKMPGYDYTYLNNVNTCPVWGIVRYGLGKTYGKGRSMALEAGKASHEVFAAIRLLELLHEEKRDHFEYHGVRLFGVDRFKDMRVHLDDANTTIDSDSQGWLNFALSALHSSGYYDDPRDRRRTLVNIEEACMAYFDRWPWGRWPLYIEDNDDPTSLVGIELPVNLVVSFDDYQIRFTGRMDGLHHHKDGLHTHENKTAASVNEAWAAGQSMSHQQTGYCVAASLLTQTSIEKVTVFGMAIPLPRTYDAGGIVRDTYTRGKDRIHDWLKWIQHTTEMIDQYMANPLDAPQYTHSCNRFFRPCSFIEMCGAPLEERQEFLDEMEYDPWDPLVEENSK